MSFHALVLAGRRGPDDALARAAGAPHRALLDVGGRAMLERVVETLRACPRIDSIRVSIDAPELLDRYPALVAARRDGAIEVVASEASPSRSVLAAFDAAGRDAPWLVTTADHALLDAPILDRFLDGAQECGADLAVGLVARSVIEARFPGARRTYLPFRDERYSGANLFAFLRPEARRAAEFWLRAEHLRKQPWKLVRTFGVGSLLLFALRRLTLEAALARASRVIGARVAPVVLPIAEAAVDVDRIEDLELARSIVARREAGAGAPAQSEATASAHNASSGSTPSSANPPPARS